MSGQDDFEGISKNPRISGHGSRKFRNVGAGLSSYVDSFRGLLNDIFRDFLSDVLSSLDDSLIDYYVSDNPSMVAVMVAT